MPPTQELLPPEIKGKPVFTLESGMEIAGCSLHPDGEIFERFPKNGVVTWCLPKDGRAHIIEG